MNNSVLHSNCKEIIKKKAEILINNPDWEFVGDNSVLHCYVMPKAMSNILISCCVNTSDSNVYKQLYLHSICLKHKL